MTNYADEKAFVIKTANHAGKFLREEFWKQTNISLKDDGSFLTKADKAVNQSVIEAVKKQYPEDDVLGEEQSFRRNGKRRLWVCDPIDGTSSFAHQAPTFAFSLALVEEGQPIVAVAYDVMLDRMITAVRGFGAELNGKATKVREADSLANEIVALDNRMQKTSKLVNALEKRKAYITGTPSVVYRSLLVALGGYVGAYGSRLISAHDVAAAKLIVEEAGGKTTSLLGKDQRYDGVPLDGFIASNSAVHDELVEAAKGV